MACSGTALLSSFLVKEDEMGGTYRIYRGDEKRLLNFDRKTRKKESWEDNFIAKK
jgi:hypothetical protein